MSEDTQLDQSTAVNVPVVLSFFFKVLPAERLNFLCLNPGGGQVELPNIKQNQESVLEEGWSPTCVLLLTVKTQKRFL